MAVGGFTMKIKCKYEYCIYEQNGICILDSVTINSIGLCDNCILPRFDNKLLSELKDEALMKLHKSEEE